MLLFNARHTDQGFTMIEITIILVIVGILSAIAAPSFLGMLNRNKVNNAVIQVRGALQEAQREAIRKSKSCTVDVPAGNNVTLTSPCFITGNRTLSGANIRRANNQATITFDFQGRTTNGDDNQAIVFSVANDTSSQEKCLIISQPLGVIRTGIYRDTLRNRTSVDPDNADTDPNCKISRN